MDDGFGKVHLVEEFYTNDKTLIDDAIKNWEEDILDFSEIYETFHDCEFNEITKTSNFNPNGYGNNIDEIRIFEEEKQIYVIG